MDDADGAYPAIALDRTQSGRWTRVTTNLGHLLGTGLLDARRSALVVARLGSPELDSGLGLRTMSASRRRVQPDVATTAGSVWPHDTGIAIAGLAKVATPEAARVAASLIEGLLRASTFVESRMPELYGSAATLAGPFPYPASCRPQAWSAATAVAIAAALFGLDVDVPNGTVSVAPLAGTGIDRISWRGLRLAGRPVDLHLEGDHIATEGLAELRLHHGQIG